MAPTDYAARMDHEDKDIAEFIAAQKRARSRGLVSALRIGVAGLVAAAAGLAVFYGVALLYADASFTGRRGVRAAMGLPILLGFLAFAVGSVSFVGVFRLLGGKVDRDTWHTILELIGLRRR